MDILLYYILYSLCYLLSLIPFKGLYLLSDITYFPLYYLVRYRRKIVRANLTSSFPEKSLKEIVAIEKKFYSFFCDYFFETMKLLSVSRESMQKRMRFEGIEDVAKEFELGRSCGLYLGHYCNWEWISSFPLYLEEEIVCGQIYHKIRNKAVDRLFLKLRGRMGAVSIPMKETLRQVVTFRREGKKFIIGFISDQSPSGANIHHWVSFLNHTETPVLTGTERIAKRLDLAMFYSSVSRPKRGYYICTIKRMTDTPQTFPDFDLTEMYMRDLEETITREPQYWLWTHKRWKWTKEKFYREYETTPDGRVKLRNQSENE